MITASPANDRRYRAEVRGTRTLCAALGHNMSQFIGFAPSTAICTNPGCELTASIEMHPGCANTEDAWGLAMRFACQSGRTIGSLCSTIGCERASTQVVHVPLYIHEPAPILLCDECAAWENLRVERNLQKEADIRRAIDADKAERHAALIARLEARRNEPFECGWRFCSLDGVAYIDGFACCDTHARQSYCKGDLRCSGCDELLDGDAEITWRYNSPWCRECGDYYAPRTTSDERQVA
jgi:hypothetical protein